MSNPTIPDLFTQLTRVTQQTDSHCGPAVIQTLLAFLSINFTQDQIVRAAQATQRILKHGTRPDQLSKAVRKLCPDYLFWFKQPTTVVDLEYLINVCHWPVAVNWQGLFYSTEAEQLSKNPEGDHGHYSVVVAINSSQDEIIISDPYSEFSHAPRVFSLRWFEDRWHDHDVYINKKTGKKNKIRTRRLIFLIAPKVETFPEDVGMKVLEKGKIVK